MKEKERLKILLYNAICYMIEDMVEQGITKEEMCEDIADYLGSSINELAELDVLDYEDIIKSNKE